MGLFRFAMPLAAAVLCAPPVVAGEPVGLELILAADVSGSMDRDVGALQRRGYIAAFRAPELHDALSFGGPVAVTYLEWGDIGQVFVIVPWTLIRNPDDAIAFAERLEAKPIRSLTKTSMGHALEFAGQYFEANDFDGLRQVIDISGNGPNNQGTRVDLVRDDLAARGVTINGLPILTETDTPRGPFDTGFDLRLLDHYYLSCVIGGPGAFVMPVRRDSDFVQAALRKLVFEISGKGGAGVTLAQFSEEAAPVKFLADCT